MKLRDINISDCRDVLTNFLRYFLTRTLSCNAYYWNGTYFTTRLVVLIFVIESINRCHVVRLWSNLILFEIKAKETQP